MQRGVAYWRRVRSLERTKPKIHPEYRSELDYDRLDIMEKVDSLDRQWRDLVNEHGFTPVIKIYLQTQDIETARRLLRQRHEQRQRDIALGRV